MTAREVLSDLLLLAGAASTTYGVSLVFEPALWIVGGAWCVVISYGFERATPPADAK